jgi:electron transport complex protein RnfE
MNKKSPWGILRNGVLEENPTLRMVLGCCPTLAITTSATNGMGMGLSTAAVMIGSNFAISALRNVIPEKVRIPCYIVIIAGFVTVIQYLLKAYVPSLDKALGIYIPLIVANCILLARAEMFAAKNPPLPSLIDGFGMGLGFTLALTLIGSVREILGAGTWFGFGIFAALATILPPEMVQAIKDASVSPAVILILPPGGFLAFGLIIMLMNKFMASVMKVTESAKNPHAV